MMRSRADKAIRRCPARRSDAITTPHHLALILGWPRLREWESCLSTVVKGLGLDVRDGKLRGKEENFSNSSVEYIVRSNNSRLVVGWSSLRWLLPPRYRWPLVQAGKCNEPLLPTHSLSWFLPPGRNGRGLLVSAPSKPVDCAPSLTMSMQQEKMQFTYRLTQDLGKNYAVPSYASPFEYATYVSCFSYVILQKLKQNRIVQQMYMF